VQSDHALETYVYPLLGHRKLSALKRGDIQGFIEEMRASGASPSTVHNRRALWAPPYAGVRAWRAAGASVATTLSTE
jgi:hypothetical protein